MRRIALLALVVAFVVFSDKAAVSGVFGNDNLILTEDQKLIFQAAGLNGEAQIRIELGEIPVPRQALAPTAPVAAPVVSPVAQASLNYQPQPIMDPFGPSVKTAPSVVIPPVQMARPPINPPPVVQPRQSETKVASVPAPKPAAPIAAPAPAKPATPAKSVAPALAKAEPGKEVRKTFAMKLPVQDRLIDGKLYKEVWLVIDEINGKSVEESKRVMDAPPAGAEILPYKG